MRVFHDMRERLARQRRRGDAAPAERAHEGIALLPSAQEFFKHYGLTPDKLAAREARRDRHAPGPMNRGVEIDSAVADGEHLGDPAAGDLRHRGAHGGDEHPGGRRPVA